MNKLEWNDLKDGAKDKDVSIDVDVFEFGAGTELQRRAYDVFVLDDTSGKPHYAKLLLPHTAPDYSDATTL